MPRRILISRRDHMQAADAIFDNSVGFWREPLSNMLDLNPQVAAEAVDNRDVSSTKFSAYLGGPRRATMIAFAGLRATSMATMRVRAGVDPTYAVNLYDSGIVPAWPVDSVAGEFDAWDRWTLNGVYLEDEYVALGMPRVFIFPATILISYILVEFKDPLARTPLTIGTFGVYDCWEPPSRDAVNFTYGWQYAGIDESDIARVPRGSTYIDLRGVRRRLNLGFPYMHEDEIWTRSFTMMLAKGRSEPFWVVPFSDSGVITRWEKAAVYGLVSQDSALSNPLLAYYALPVQIDQLY